MTLHFLIVCLTFLTLLSFPFDEMAIGLKCFRRTRLFALTILHVYLVICLAVTFSLLHFSANSTSQEQPIQYSEIYKYFSVPTIAIVIFSSIRTGIFASHRKLRLFVPLIIFVAQTALAFGIAIGTLLAFDVKHSAVFTVIAIPSLLIRLFIEYLAYKVYKELELMYDAEIRMESSIMEENDVLYQLMNLST